MEGLKTNEFHLRRRLRLQQVREQSKDIARTVRERANKEYTRQLGCAERDTREDYIQRQERLVQRLERIHAGALHAVGDAHSQAADIREKAKLIKKPVDQSKPRAKVAALQLKRIKQQELDKKKQSLDRKVIARNLANTRSRLKLSKVVSKTVSNEGGSGDTLVNISTAAVDDSVKDAQQDTAPRVEHDTADIDKHAQLTTELTSSKKDTQTQMGGLQEWAPTTSSSAVGLQRVVSQCRVNQLPSSSNAAKQEKNADKRTDLFAVSKEMPEGLLGSMHKTVPAASDLQSKLSLTAVSDFLRTRDHRLQKPVPGFHKVSDHELQGLRETLLRTKRKDGSSRGTHDICRVVDDEAIPVPRWQPVPDCGFCTFDYVQAQPLQINRNLLDVTQIEKPASVNTTPRKPRPSFDKLSAPPLLSLPHPPSPAMTQPHSTNRAVNASPSRLSKSSASGQSTFPLSRKPSVIHYDHTTKATRDLPLDKEKVVQRVTNQDLDAYSLALKESEEMAASNNREHDDAQLRSRLAVSRQSVAVEYRDTMAFLQAMSKNNEKSKPIETAYMDDHQQRKRRVSHQRKLEHEFEKMQVLSKSRAKATRVSDIMSEVDRRLLNKPKKQSTMAAHLPSDAGDITSATRTSVNNAQLLLHQIRKNVPTREEKSRISRNKDDMKRSSKVANTVKFDFEPSSYAYSSRDKQTPPTKDLNENPKSQDKNINETECNNGASNVHEEGETSDETVISDCSSDYDLIIQRHNRAKSKEINEGKSDVRKFIVYKIRDSSDEDVISRIKQKHKLNEKTAESNLESSSGNKNLCNVENKPNMNGEHKIKSSQVPAKLNKTQELLVQQKEDIMELLGDKSCVYEHLHENSPATFQICHVDYKKRTSWWEDSDVMKCECNKKKQTADKENKCNRLLKNMDQSKKPLEWDIDSVAPESREDFRCNSNGIQERGAQPAASVATSAATFKTATSDKSSAARSAASAPRTDAGSGGYVKVLDEAGEEAGKFYIGASHQTSNDPYEVIIQLKRKDGSHSDKGIQSSHPTASSALVQAARTGLPIPAASKYTPTRTPTQEVQFSSSSSTVYMSPPDMILPKFLKADYKIMGKDVQKESQNKESIALSCSPRDCEKKTKDIADIKEVGESRVRSARKTKQSRPKLLVEPTSSTTSPSTRHKGVFKRSCRNISCEGCNKLGTEHDFIRRKANEESNLNTCKKHSKSNKQKNKQKQLEKKIMQHYHNQLCHMLTNTPNAPNLSKTKSNLSPLVQKYIIELLELSDGPRSAEIAALQCSTVTTPGSSVVNLPSNVEPATTQWKQDQIQAKINEIITRNLLQFHCTKSKISSTSYRRKSHEQESSTGVLPLSTTTSSDSPSIERGVGDVPRLHLNRLRTKPKSVYRHKVKSLNISKNVLKYFKTVDSEERQNSIYYRKSIARLTSSDTGQRSSEIKRMSNLIKGSKIKSCHKNIPTGKSVHKPSKNLNEEKNTRHFRLNNNNNVRKTFSAPGKQIIIIKSDEENKIHNSLNNKHHDLKQDVNNDKTIPKECKTPVRKTFIKHTNSPPVKDENCRNVNAVTTHNPNSPPTQTEHNNSDNLMSIAEDKLHNMEKIADLTEKCTKRLSDLAKVLDEVRKNKSSMYNQISSADTSFSGHSSGKRVNPLKSNSEEETYIAGLKGGDKSTQALTANNNSPVPSPEVILPEYTPDCAHARECCNSIVKLSPTATIIKDESLTFIPILGDIQKPEQSPLTETNFGTYVENPTAQRDEVFKIRSKPPPALSRMNLKGEEAIVPHELSTVLEVDSPMSTRNASSRIKLRDRSPINTEQDVRPIEPNVISDTTPTPKSTSTALTAPCLQPHTPQLETAKDLNIQSVTKGSASQSSTSQLRNPCEVVEKLPVCQDVSIPQNAKLKMMDINKFNEIMLKPFISIEEYARQYNVALLDEGSNLEDAALNKNTPNGDEEMSSLNSDGTLPDIISELLKRNIISEPFNFDGATNVDSNAISSESNGSVLALSKVKRHKKVTINSNSNDNNCDTSDTLSVSSKIDLEKAFEELGIGWASSTLKKTKETLALSSSTSTLSSTEQINYRKFKKFDSSKKLLQQLQGMLNDSAKSHNARTEHNQQASVPGVLCISSEEKENKREPSKSKHNVELQTSLTFQQPVSVKEFLANSLANKITFSNKSQRPDEEEHFSSLYSTKMTCDNSLVDKQPAKIDTILQHDSSKHTRQRTSTPVQLFKSLTFNSSTSSYNNSNGFFSNFDDLSSVKGTSVSLKNSSSTDKDELTVPNCSLKLKKVKSGGSDTG